jgi:hypothetical protein
MCRSFALPVSAHEVQGQTDERDKVVKFDRQLSLLSLSAVMDLIRSYYYASTKPELLNALIFTEAFFTLPFVICSFVVASTANAGFNCVLTGMLNVGLAAGSYYVLKTSKSPLAVRISQYNHATSLQRSPLSFPFADISNRSESCLAAQE